VSLDTIAQIEKRNKLEEKAKNRNLEILGKQEYLKEIELHQKLAEGIHLLFMSNNGRPILVSQVMSQLGDKTRGQFTSKPELYQMISSLTKILPGWLIMATLPSGTIVRQKAPIEMHKMHEEIKHHFEKNKQHTN
jgi:hypothetical protein